MSKKAAKGDRQRREMMRLQAAIAKQQAEYAKQYLPPDDGPQPERVRPVVGMPADVVLALPGYGAKDATRAAQRNGWDRNGLIVRWHYADVILTLRRYTEPGQPLCYRVSEIEEVGGSGEESKPR